MIFDSKKIIYAIVFISLAIGFSINEYNLHLLRQVNPDNKIINAKSTFHDETIWSVDNEFYLSPPENFLAGKEWRRDPPLGNGSYFRRVPGYSIFYLFFRTLFDTPLALKLLKFAQMLLFGLSVICIYKTLKRLQFNNTIAAVVTISYGFTPFFSGFAYYTCTESITPYLAVFYLYFLMRAYCTEDAKIKWNSYLIASLLIGIFILTRPPMGLLALSFPVCFFKDYFKEKNIFYFTKKSILIAILPLLLIGTWTIRNYLLTKEFVPLEKSYHPQSLDRMKPEYDGIISFITCWGGKASEPTYFNEYYVPFQASVLVYGDTGIAYIENILKAWPVQIVNEFGKERLTAILKLHQRALYEQKPYYDKQIAMPPDYFPEQLQVQKEYHKLENEYFKKHFFSYCLQSPLLYFKNMVVHSNTSQLFIFQKEVLGHKLLFAYKSLLFLLHILLYLTLFFNLFLIKNVVLKTVFAITPLVFVVFFCFIFRLIEQRYMLPVLPIMVLGLAFPLNYFFSKWRSS